MYHVMNIHHSLPKASFHNENSLLSFIRGSFCQTKRIPHLQALNLPSNEWSELVFSQIHSFEQRSLSQNDYSHHNYSKTKSKYTIGISSFYSLSSSHTLTIHSPHDPTHSLKLQLSLYTKFTSLISIETLFSLISTYFFHITNLEWVICNSILQKCAIST